MVQGTDLSINIHELAQNINKINDIDDVSPIIGLDLNNIALLFTFGTLFGGESSKGDEAYKLMLKKD